MNIAFVTSEAYPFAKTGGLADVSNALPRALARQGHDVRIFMPRYYVVDQKKYSLKLTGSPLGVPLGSGEKWCALYESSFISGVTTCFIEHDHYFGRDGLYDDGRHAFDDNAERFIFFSRAVLQAMKSLKFKPDVIHCNDWQSGLVPLFLKSHYAGDPFYRDTRSLMTVHNVGYQGVFPKEVFPLTRLGWEHFSKDGHEFFGQINFLKEGILHADAVSTVSKRYSLEIQSREFGYDLADEFKKVSHRLFGIINGVDYTKWTPASDTLLPANYPINDMSGKRINKTKLQELMHLPPDGDIPVIGCISRLTYQKGIDLLVQSLEWLLQSENFNFVILGSGEQWIIDRFQYLKSLFPERLGLFWGYNEELSHLVEAGSDIFVMPSRYEPCGLNQMYSMAYGTIPVVHGTGGLDDTVENWDEAKETGNGFKYPENTVDQLYSTLRKALRACRHPDKWEILQKNAMSFHNSWDDAVKEYENLYTLLLNP